MESIPDYLMPFVATQDPSLYTPIDHASWRYMMRVSKNFFKDHAHQKYLDGLRETGISSERIPLISEMDTCLRRFGWRAVAVVGFIPPAVFLEFQSMGILVIGCDIRCLQNLAYTAAPDIFHEAAGHAPIIADPEYRDYLRSYGEVARNAIFTKQDMDVYDSIRALSDLKEDPNATREQIAATQAEFEALTASVHEVSEATQLSRIAWWTLEYGLVGPIEKPLIYGAGLLSSVGESYHCLDSVVEKRPLTVACVEQGYDITKPQPHLYVTPDFATLSRVLQEFGATMAFRRGGVEGLSKAKRAETTTTTVLESGIQISSVLSNFIQDANGTPIYLQYQGPTQLAFANQQLDGQGPSRHPQGFGTPIGRVVMGSSIKKSPHLLTSDDLERLGFVNGKSSRLDFESGIRVKGILTDQIMRDGNSLVLTFESCTVSLGSQILFQPDWGSFDMACGERIVSVFGGAADRAVFMNATGGFKQRPASQKTNSTPQTKTLETLYSRLREIRETEQAQAASNQLSEIHQILSDQYPNDWLLRLELLELNQCEGLQAPWAAEARRRLDELALRPGDQKELIIRGLELIQ